ncbi:hypothetical protein NFI96_017606 [Prochilodus magdalenae]|nr:hypothetical protein NFI96_017606 [Prochilodus magdalenae]
MCNVKNGKDVNLSWYEEKERISSINSSDCSEDLNLPLEIINSNNSTYTCVAANPVSNHMAQLNITELCYIDTVSQNAELTYAEVNITTHKVNRVGVTDQDQYDSVEYSAIRQ